MNEIGDFNAGEVLEGLGTGVAVLDASLRILYLNPTAEQLLGLSLRLARGAELGTLRPHRELADLMRRALDSSRSFTCRELALAVPQLTSGEQPLVDCRVSPLGDTDPPAGLLLELRDARTRLRVDQELAQLAQQQASRRMLRQLAHEIKNPLGGLRGAAQLLERRLDGPALREYTGVILREADRLASLVDRMLGPGAAPRRTQTNIHEVLRHVRRLVEAEAPPGVSVEEDYDPSLPAIALDRDQMVQALLNLARNALQAVGAEGRIRLRTRALTQATIDARQHPLAVRVDVEDDGPGVPESIRTTLFYPLVSGGDGTGLGLALAQELVGRHGGALEYHSRPGHTVFSVLLPAQMPA